MILASSFLSLSNAALRRFSRSPGPTCTTPTTSTESSDSYVLGSYILNIHIRYDHLATKGHSMQYIPSNLRAFSEEALQYLDPETTHIDISSTHTQSQVNLSDILWTHTFPCAVLLPRHMSFGVVSFSGDTATAACNTESPNDWSGSCGVVLLHGNVAVTPTAGCVSGMMSSSDGEHLPSTKEAIPW